MCLFCNLAGVASGGLGCGELPNPTDLSWGDATNSSASDASMGAASVFSLAQIVQQLRTQWGGSFEGTTESWSGSSAINYYIGDTPYPSGSGEIAHKANMTALMVSRAALGFELWDDLIARDLNPVSIAAFGQVQFEYATQTYNANGVLSQNGGTYSGSWGSATGSNAYGTTNYGITRSEIWLNSNWGSHNQDSDMYYGGYGFQTYLHEIGHSLGMSHPGSYDAGNGDSITYANSAEYSLDNRQYTIMSYFGGYKPGVGWQQDGTSSNWLYSSTPMLDDVAAIQSIYGADMTTRVGDTTYGFHVTAGVPDVFNFTIDTTPIVTVWDAGGNDTLDLSGYAANQRIDLHAGTYSDIGGMLSNFAIAYNVTIENAIGGSGSDAIIGNVADNTLYGGGGNDTIDGGLGSDSATFSGLRAAYSLTTIGANSVRVVGPDGADTVTNVERLVFDDQIVPASAIGSAIIQDPPPPPGVALDEWQISNGKWAASINPGSHPIGSKVAAVGDFNHDGTSDLLWVNSSTNAVDAWKLSNGKWAASVDLGTSPAGYQVAGAGDFNGDGTSDVLWFNPSTNQTDIWILSNGQWAASTTIGAHPAGYQIAGTGDVNHEGTSDVVWFNPASGDVDVWKVQNGKWAGSVGLGSHPGSGWQVAGTGDFNHDGNSDIFWFNPATGATDIWQLVNGQWLASVSPGSHPGEGWQVGGIGDFNADRTSDILWHNPTTGQVDEWQIVNGHWAASFDLGIRPGGIAGIGDFNKDGAADVMWHL